MFGLSTIGSAGSAMWGFLALFAGSNVLLQIRASRPNLKVTRWTWYLTLLCDILLITWVVYVRGGARTDTYLLYMLVVCEAGILLNRVEAWLVGLLSLAAYAGAVLAVNGAADIDRVLIRAIYLMVVGVTTTYLAAAEKHALRDSLTDSKTQLPNFRLFQETLTESVALARREGLPLSVAIVDVDNFRQLNAQIGHPSADRVLEQLAEVLVAWKRPEDLIARYGGEEFIFMLPGVCADEAFGRLERLRARIADTPFALGCEQPVQITVSGGVASLATAPTVNALMITADRGLLRAKAEGKDRLIIAG